MHYILPILSILFGVFIFGVGSRFIVEIYLDMTWLHIRVNHRPDVEKVSYSISNMVMRTACFCPIIGLALVLIGIKYL